MTLYERNLKILAEYYPGMDTLIENAVKVMQKDLEIAAETSLDGRRIIRIKKDGRECYLGGKRNAADPPEKWVESLGSLQERSPVLMIGTGNPGYLQELAEKTGNSLVIVIYEPSLQIFIDFLEHTALEKIMKKHTVVFWVEGIDGMTKQGLKTTIGQILNFEIAPFSRTFIIPNYDILFPDETLYFIRVCHDILSSERVHFYTKKRFEGLMVKNLFANLRYLCDGYKTTQMVKVIPRDIPGIVVAAGPSLNKNIRELKKAKGKAFIIAVDTAVKPLLREGIVPDMFAIVDAKKPLDLVQVDGAGEIPLVTTTDAASAILEYHTGMKFFANEGTKLLDRLFFRCDRQVGYAVDGGSVATAAFTLLFKIGLQRIILVGQDLAFTNNRSHADGTFQEEMPEHDTSRFRMVDGNNGGKVPTRPDFQLYLDWYNKRIGEYRELYPEFHVINATEGGALIKNTEVMTLREAIERECTREVDIQKCFSELSPLFTGEDRQWVIDQLKMLPEECAQFSEEARKTCGLYKKLDRICSNRTVDQKAYLKVLKKLEKQIKKIETHEIYQLVGGTLNLAQYIIKNEQLLTYDSTQEEGKEIARKGILYMKSVAECAQVFGEYADSIFGNWNG